MKQTGGKVVPGALTAEAKQGPALFKSVHLVPPWWHHLAPAVLSVIQGITNATGLTSPELSLNGNTATQD